MHCMHVCFSFYYTTLYVQYAQHITMCNVYLVCIVFVLLGVHRASHQWVPPGSCPPNYPQHYGSQVMAEQYRLGTTMPPYGSSLAPCISPHSRTDPCGIPIQVCELRCDINLYPACLKLLVSNRDVTDSESLSKSDGIRHFFRNPKSDGYLKSDRVGFEIVNC